MSDLMREEFKAAYKLEVIRQGKTFDSVVFTRESSGDYIVGLVQSAWWAWQASRESLAIPLPCGRVYSHSEAASEADYYFDQGQSDGLSKARALIHAAGVKTK